MGTMATLRGTYPRVTRQFGKPVSFLGRIGDHTLFYGRALGGVPHAMVHFRREIIRLIAEISMGAGTLAMIGGTVVIVGFLTLATGGVLLITVDDLAGRSLLSALEAETPQAAPSPHQQPKPHRPPSPPLHSTRRLRLPAPRSPLCPPPRRAV